MARNVNGKQMHYCNAGATKAKRRCNVSVTILLYRECVPTDAKHRKRGIRSDGLNLESMSMEYNIMSERRCLRGT